MKIFITASKSAYHKVADVITELEKVGHSVTPPNKFDNPDEELTIRELSQAEHAAWKGDIIHEDMEIVAAHDAILVLNVVEKYGQQNYIGGSTFLEMFKAFELGKKLYLYNPIPDGMLTDEIIGFSPVVIHGDLSLIN